jgi:hypothetical protein
MISVRPQLHVNAQHQLCRNMCYLTGMFWDLLTWTLDLYIDVFWYGVIQRGRSPFKRIALPSSLMLWLKVVPSDGIGILPLICAWRPRGCTI